MATPHPTPLPPTDLQLQVPQDVLARYLALGQNPPHPLRDLLPYTPPRDYTFAGRPQVDFSQLNHRTASMRALGLIHVVAAILQPQLGCLRETPLLVELLAHHKSMVDYPLFAELVHTTMAIEGNKISQYSYIMRRRSDQSPLLFNVLDQGAQLYKSTIALATTYAATHALQAIVQTPLIDVMATPSSATPQRHHYVTLVPTDAAATGLQHAAPHSIQQRLQALNSWVTTMDVYLLLAQLWRYSYSVFDPLVVQLLVDYQLLELLFPLVFWSEVHHQYEHRFATHIPLLNPDHIVWHPIPFFV
jgi:hypothetical protein